MSIETKLRDGSQAIKQATRQAEYSSKSPARRHPGLNRPVLAWVGGIAIVAVLAIPVVLLEIGSGANQQADLGGPPSSSVIPIPDAPILVVFFADGLREPSASAIESLGALGEVKDLLIVDRESAEAEIRQGMTDAGLPEDEPLWSDGPGIPATVRLRVETDQDVDTVAEIASELDNVVHVDAYFGSIDYYPAWRLQNSTVVEGPVVTTTSIAPARP